MLQLRQVRRDLDPVPSPAMLQHPAIVLRVARNDVLRASVRGLDWHRVDAETELGDMCLWGELAEETPLADDAESARRPLIHSGPVDPTLRARLQAFAFGSCCDRRRLSRPGRSPKSPTAIRL